MKILALLLGLVAIAVAVAVIGHHYYPTPSAPPPPASTVASDATVYRYACEIVRSNLKAPRTAIFGSLEDGTAYVIRHPNDVVEVYSFVDSENSFGAMLRLKWKIGAFAYKDRLTSAFYIKIGDRETGHYGDIGLYSKGGGNPSASAFTSQPTPQSQQ